MPVVYVLLLQYGVPEGSKLFRPDDHLMKLNHQQGTVCGSGQTAVLHHVKIIILRNIYFIDLPGKRQTELRRLIRVFRFGTDGQCIGRISSLGFCKIGYS